MWIVFYLRFLSPHVLSAGQCPIWCNFVYFVTLRYNWLYFIYLVFILLDTDVYFVKWYIVGHTLFYKLNERMFCKFNLCYKNVLKLEWYIGNYSSKKLMIYRWTLKLSLISKFQLKLSFDSKFQLKCFTIPSLNFKAINVLYL